MNLSRLQQLAGLKVSPINESTTTKTRKIITEASAEFTIVNPNFDDSSEDPNMQYDITVDVEYVYYGEHVPASWEEPGDEPELEILSIIDASTGQDLRHDEKVLAVVYDYVSSHEDELAADNDDFNIPDDYQDDYYESKISEVSGKGRENRDLWDKINSKGVVPSIDKEKYTDLSYQGLEGPFRLKSGKVVYYDPKEGKYYDRDSDMYMSHDDYDHHSSFAEEAGEDDFDDFDNELFGRTIVDGITVWDLTKLSGHEAYDVTQSNENLKDGDVLHLSTGNAVLMSAWPVIVTGDIDQFHRLGSDYSWDTIDNGKYAKAASVASSYKPMDEDITNGYGSEHYASPKDYFPNGSDGPTVSVITPNGRQGDNTMQKKINVAEVHKELVSAYRTFLKESKSR